MITYLYWLFVFGITLTLLYVFGAKVKNWRIAAIAGCTALIIGWAAYFFHFQQILLYLVA